MANTGAGVGAFLSGFSNAYGQGKALQGLAAFGDNAGTAIAKNGVQDTTGKDVGAMGMPTSFKAYGDGATIDGPKHATGANGGLGLPASASSPAGDGGGLWSTIQSLFSGASN